MKLGFGFNARLEEIERTFVSALGLRPRALPAGLDRGTGQFREAPVVLQARAYEGPRVRYARFVSLTGADLEIANALCVPRPEYAAPIFGMDLVGLGTERGGVAVADLSPVSDREAQVNAMRERIHPPAGLRSAGELPAWCAPWFSPLALFARVSEGDAEILARSLDEYASAFVDLTLAAAARSEQAREVTIAQNRYAAAHREDDAGLRLLARILGEVFAREFISRVLFPEHGEE